MFASLHERVKGFRTIIWARLLWIGGILSGLALTALPMIDGTQIGVFIPQQYTPFIPFIIAIIGGVTELLRRATTGPVGSKGDEAPKPDTKAGD